MDDVKLLVAYNPHGLHHLQAHRFVPKFMYDNPFFIARLIVAMQIEMYNMKVKPCDVRWAVLSSSTLYHHERSGSWRVWIPKTTLTDTWWLNPTVTMNG